MGRAPRTLTVSPDQRTVDSVSFARLAHGILRASQPMLPRTQAFLRSYQDNATQYFYVYFDDDAYSLFDIDAMRTDDAVTKIKIEMPKVSPALMSTLTTGEKCRCCRRREMPRTRQ